MGPTRFRVLLIGCGNIAGRFDMVRPANAWPVTQAGAFRRHGGYDLVACVDPNEQVRNAFANFWGVQRHADSLDALQAQPGEFDVIGLCSPTTLHHTHLEAVLSLRPKAIFCEKPITQSLQMSVNLERACVASGIALFVNYTRQWDSSVDKLLEEVRAGRWGVIRSAVGYYNKGIHNNGGHLVDILLRLLGPLEVVAASVVEHDHIDNDPTLAGLLRSVAGHVPVCLAPGNSKDFAFFELELVCELGVIRMLNGGMQWQVRKVEESLQFRGYRSLNASLFNEGNYLQAMTLAVTEIHQHLLLGVAVRNFGAHALAIQAICEQLLASATNAAPPTYLEYYD